jgi:hypothetical protein
MSEDIKHARVLGTGTPAPWGGILGVPAVWAVHLQVVYAMVPWVCTHHKMWLLHLTTIVSLAVGGLLLGTTWIDYHRTGRARSDSLESGVHSRGRFLGALGILVAAMFLLLIAAQGVPAFFIDPCSD